MSGRGSAGCWLWTGGQLGRGYGQFGRRVDGVWRPTYAHRVSWEIANGPIPKDLHILHKCDVRLCVNPAHLFLGDQDANMKDAARKGRLSVPRPSRHKVTPAQIAEIVALYAVGVKGPALARQFGVSKSFISLVVNGKRRVYTAPQLQQKAS